MLQIRKRIFGVLCASSLLMLSTELHAQFEQQGRKLVGTNAVGAAQQGCAVAISADGNTAIVGGSLDFGWTGATWVYKRLGLVWSQQGEKLVGTGGEGWMKRQGSSLALSADGNTAIVGGHYDNNGAGAAWIFTRSGETWSQQGSKLVGSGAVGYAGQGISVGISSDGNTVIVGGYLDNSTTGAAWVFARSGDVWTQQGSKLVGSGAVGGAAQGISVALSGDGNTAIVGGYLDNGNKGAVWIYTRQGTDWSQQGNKLVGTGAVGNARFGTSVSTSSDGNTVIIGAANDNANTGAVWIFRRIDGVWSQQGEKLVGSGGVATTRQGVSVSLVGSGNMALVGGHLDNNNSGASWIFVCNAGTWSQLGQKICGTGGVGPGEQGTSVAISSDGFTAIVGGQYDSANVGAAWIFASVTPVPITLSSFTGRLLNNRTVQLTWVTASEIDNYGFYVEKRSAGQIIWRLIEGSFVPGHGTTNLPHDYTYTDRTPLTASAEYRLKQVDLDGSVHFSEPILITSPTGVTDISKSRFELSQNFPNPFNPSTSISFVLARPCLTRLKVFDILGREVATLLEAEVEEGSHSVEFNALRLAGGMYVYRIEAGEFAASRRLLLIR